MSTSVSAVTSNAGSLYATNSLQGSAKALDQNDFLKLLVTQIQYQDPLNPKSNTDMAAQMAQFTALQQTTDMSSSLSMLQANNLIGNQVTLQLDSRTRTIGIVEGVTMNNGKPQITVQGRTYDLSQIVAVAPPPAPVTPTTSTTTSSN